MVFEHFNISSFNGYVNEKRGKKRAVLKNLKNRPRHIPGVGVREHVF